jgi:hypothetical protein
MRIFLDGIHPFTPEVRAEIELTDRSVRSSGSKRLPASRFSSPEG